MNEEIVFTRKINRRWTKMDQDGDGDGENQGVRYYQMGLAKHK
jgi:hypothetical protein